MILVPHLSCITACMLDISFWPFLLLSTVCALAHDPCFPSQFCLHPALWVPLASACVSTCSALVSALVLSFSWQGSDAHPLWRHFSSLNACFSQQPLLQVGITSLTQDPVSLSETANVSRDAHRHRSSHLCHLSISSLFH